MIPKRAGGFSIGNLYEFGVCRGCVLNALFPLITQREAQPKQAITDVCALRYACTAKNAHRVPLLRSPVWGAQQRCAVAHRATVPRQRSPENLRKGK